MRFIMSRLTALCVAATILLESHLCEPVAGVEGFSSKQRRIVELHREIHTQLTASQNPSDCASARLLIVDYKPDESIERFLLSLAVGLAEAFYSERTLVIGPTPFIARQPALSCGGSGSLFECFFASLGSCTISAVSHARTPGFLSSFCACARACARVRVVAIDLNRVRFDLGDRSLERP